MWATITKPFAWLMVRFHELTGSYGVAVILFALAINLILAPFMAKSKKSMMRTNRIQPQLKELQKRHEGNPQKLNQEMQKLYREEGINPMSGCLWSLIPFPILLALYGVIRMPLTRMMYVGQDVVTAITDFLVNKGWYTVPAKADAYAEMKLANILSQHFEETVAHLQSLSLPTDRLLKINFNFLGLDLGAVPWDVTKGIFTGAVAMTVAACVFMLIPFISAFLSWLSMKVSTASNPQPDAQSQATMQSMNLMMPLMSIWICFIMPAAMGVYWIVNTVFGMGRDVLLTSIYKKQLDKEDAERIAARKAREQEIEERRLETERLKAEGKTEMNVNTSKKKIQASEKQKSDERKAALEKAERAARRERLGIKEEEKPASQVGNRRFARGRAYVPDRFSNPEAAAEATLAAAQASEGMSSIDDQAEETENTVNEASANTEE